MIREIGSLPSGRELDYAGGAPSPSRRLPPKPINEYDALMRCAPGEEPALGLVDAKEDRAITTLVAGVQAAVDLAIEQGRFTRREYDVATGVLVGDMGRTRMARHADRSRSGVLYTKRKVLPILQEILAPYGEQLQFDYFKEKDDDDNGREDIAPVEDREERR